jgi:hypothetical protein
MNAARVIVYISHYLDAVDETLRQGNDAHRIR